MRLGLGFGLGELPLRSRAAGIAPRRVAYLLAGQSNMVGMAAFDGGADYPAGVLQLARAGGPSGGADGTLVPAHHQLDYPGASAANFGPALQFAIAWVAANPRDTLILVPTAVQGTGFVDGSWTRAGARYLDSIQRMNALFAVAPDVRFGGILWGQGERDSKGDGLAAYQAALDTCLTGFRQDISKGAPTTPISIQGFDPGLLSSGSYPDAAAVQAILADTPSRLGHTAYCDTSDLTGGGLHFDAPSLRILGARHHAAQIAARSNPGPAAAATSVSFGVGEVRIDALAAPRDTPNASFGAQVITLNAGA